MVQWRSLSIPRCCYNFLYMPFLCVFCSYRVGINLRVHNKAESNLEIKKTRFFNFRFKGILVRLQNNLTYSIYIDTRQLQQRICQKQKIKEPLSARVSAYLESFNLWHLLLKQTKNLRSFTVTYTTV